MTGPLIILSGPSGCGKSTVLHRLLQTTSEPLRLAVSATTRSPRPGERGGVQYYFWDREHFEEELKANAFLEYAEVYGNYYGTLWREVTPYREQGTGVILEIDVQGAANVRKICPDNVSIFLRAPSPEEYEKRLRIRGTEDEPTIRRRLDAAARELAQAHTYDHTVINDDLNAAVAELRTIVRRLFVSKE